MYIYTIRCKSDDKQIYIGSTKTSLSRRGFHHKSCSKTNNKSPLYIHINANGGWDNYYIELYESFEGTTDELKKREGEIIRQFKTDTDMFVINHRIAGRTPLQSIKDRYDSDEIFRDKCKEYAKKRYYDNKDSIVVNQTKTCALKHEETDLLE